MNRAAVATEVGVELSALLADAGMLATDDSGNLKEPLDRALQAVGVNEAVLGNAAADYSRGLPVLATYQTLRSILRRIGTRFDVGISGDSYRLNQTVANVRALLAEAEGEVVRIYGSLEPGADVPAAGSGPVSWDLDFLVDPVCEVWA